jgi:uncharacterized OsmC-like protein
MYGTLADALEARKIPFDRTTFLADVEGRIERVGKTLRITAIAVHYRVAVAKKHRAATERAVKFHAEACPAHNSVKDSIRVSWDMRIEEV